MRKFQLRLVIASLSLASASLVAWLAFPVVRAEQTSVLIVNNGAEIGDLLSARVAKSAPVFKVYPPPLVREVLDEQTAALFFPAASKSSSWTYDPDCYSRRIAHQPSSFRRMGEHANGGWNHRTNDYGMREDEDVRRVRPDVRILLTGDSHMDGLCANSESLANVLEVLLEQDRPGQSVESLNAGVGSFNLYNYVGQFERLKHLRPDVFVVVVYGGNDFSGAMRMQRYFEHREPSRAAGIDTEIFGTEDLRTIGAQEVNQELYFHRNPEDVEIVIGLACSISVELERQCEELGTELMFVYLPPPSRGQPELFEDTLEAFLERTQTVLPEYGVSDRIADSWLRFLEQRGIAAVDLRAGFCATSETLYWNTDHHLNVEGHRRAAELVHDPLAELLGRGGG